MRTAWSITLCVAASVLVTDGETVSYAREILPILSDKYFHCHGPDEGNREADLRLDVRDAAIEAFAWDPENPAKSEALLRIFSTDEDEVMPPPKSHLQLTDGQKQLIQRWVEEGATYETHWAFVAPPETITPPEPKQADWVKNPIDAFVLQRLEAANLQPSPPAPKPRWLRRVTFDLTGLPPTQAELDDFLADDSDGAFERVVDRLLASPRFGERMATPWLDVARYADSFGYQADVHTDAWPYRDWVIQAFNDNKPFDQFIIEQLAGDLLENPARDQKLATAFNRIHRKTNEGGSVPEEFRQDGISDRVHTVGTAFLGLTMECSRCHDHKYDPITMEDYYSMGAFFNSIDEFGLVQGGGNKGIVLPNPALKLPTKEQEKEIAALREATLEAERNRRAYLESGAAEQAFQTWKQSPGDCPEPEFLARFTFDEKDPTANLNGKEKAKYSGQLSPSPRGHGVETNGDDPVSLPAFGITNSEQPMTISLWVKPGEDYSRAVVFANTSSFDANYSGYELLLEHGKLRWTLAREFPGCSASVVTKDSIPTGTWTHIAVSSDGSQKAAGLRIHLNGAPAATEVVKDTLTRDYHIGGGLQFAARGRDLGLRGGVVDEITVHRRDLTNWEISALHSGKRLAKLDSSEAELRDYFFSAVDPEARQLTAAVNVARTKLRKADDQVREIMTMREIEPVPHFILERGDYTMPGKQVTRRTPDWLPPFPQDQPRNRLGFARWLTMPDHPLTARVTVNRLWQEIFGRGIVESSDNFGLQGAQPTHPALLDWLARDFIQSGWDQKRAIKQMVLSAAYRQDSVASKELREIDPHNQLLSRGPARRLTAEQLRDSALAHAGLLVETIGGPPVKPYQAPGSMWKTLNNFLPEYKADKGDGLFRRSLYTFWRRTTTPPNMMIFDTTTRDVCATRRMTTNTPLQPLVMLNDPQYVEAARKLGERIVKLGGDSDEARAAWAYREVTGHQPDDRRLGILTELVSEQRQLFRTNESDAMKFLKVGDSPVDVSLDQVEVAVFATLAQALLNLDAHISLR